MSVDADLVIILANKFGYLEKRVTYLEGKCRGQQTIIEKLIRKLKKCKRSIASKDMDRTVLVERGLNHLTTMDIKPNVNSIDLPISNGTQKENLTQIEPSNVTGIQKENSENNDPKLSQNCVVKMGTKCPEIPKEKEIPQVLIIQKQTSKIWSKLSLPKHKNKNKPQFCSICSKYVTNFLAHMRVHVHTHTGERPFKCKTCSKSFKHMGELKIHSRIHTGEKPYSCSVCSKSFTQSSNFNIHKKIHTGEKPYSCSICSKSFSRTHHVKVHIKMIHNRGIPISP